MGLLVVVYPKRAWQAFLRSGLLLAVALIVFVGVFLLQPRWNPPVTAPRSDVLERLAEEKRRLLRDNFAHNIEVQREAIAAFEPRIRPARPILKQPTSRAAASSHVVSPPMQPPPSTEPAATTDPDVLKAIALIDNGQISEAVAALEAVIKKDPKNEQALVELAMIQLLDLKDPDQAIAYLQKAVTIAPGNQVVLSELVSLYDDQERVDDGIAFLQEIDRQQPGSPDVAYGLGQLMSLAGRDVEAIPYLEKAATQGDALRAYRDLAEAYSRAGDSERAIDSYDKALASMERDLASKHQQGLPAAYIEERIHYTKLDKARELMRVNDLDGAQRLLDEVGRLLPGDEGVASLQQNLNRKRAG